jgi:hypothetical protein
MTAIIAFVFFFVVPIPNQQSLPPACAMAAAHYVAKTIELNTANHIRFEQLFGRPVSRIDIPRECPQAAPYARWRLPQVRSLLPSWNHAVAQCAAAGVDLSTRIRGATPPVLVGALETLIATCHGAAQAPAAARQCSGC